MSDKLAQDIALALMLRPRNFISAGSVHYPCPLPAREWYLAASALGSVSGTHRRACCNFMRQMQGKSYLQKIWLFLPFGGSNLDTAMVPLINRMKNTGLSAEGTLQVYVNGTLDSGTSYDVDGGIKAFPANNGFLLGNAPLYDLLPAESTYPHNVGMAVWLTDPTPVGSFGFGIRDTRLAGAFECRNYFLISGGGTTYFQCSISDATGTLCQVSPNPAYTHGFWHASCAPLGDARFMINGVNQTTNGVTQVGAIGYGLRAGIGRANAIPGDPAGDEPASQNSMPVTAACFAITNGTMTDGERTDFYETVRDYWVVPTGRDTAP